MKLSLTAAIFATLGMAVMTQPASACPAGYQAAWIQGHKICRIKTPKLPIKANQGREPSGALRKSR